MRSLGLLVVSGLLVAAPASPAMPRRWRRASPCSQRRNAACATPSRVRETRKDRSTRSAASSRRTDSPVARLSEGDGRKGQGHAQAADAICDKLAKADLDALVAYLESLKKKK